MLPPPSTLSVSVVSPSGESQESESQVSRLAWARCHFLGRGSELTHPGGIAVRRDQREISVQLAQTRGGVGRGRVGWKLDGNCVVLDRPGPTHPYRTGNHDKNDRKQTRKSHSMTL
jgi:hypothetical protein